MTSKDEDTTLPVKPTHDALFRAIIDDKDRAAALLRDYLPERVSAQMADTPPKRVAGSFVDEDAHLKHSDGLFEITLKGGRPALAYVLLEHKSVSEPATPLQILGYMLRIWLRYGDGQAARLRALPVIVPLVFYHGSHSWNVPRVFGEMFDAGEDMARYVPSFTYEVHDLGNIPMEELSHNPHVMAGLAVLKFVKHRSDMTREHLEEILRRLPFGTNFAGIVLRYFVARYEWTQPDMEAVLDGIDDEGGKALMGTLAETWKKEGEAKGLAAGEALGREKGLAAGEALGHEKGLAEGEAKGLAEGEAKGEAKLLMHLLVKRFGPLPEPVIAQIAAGSIDDLDRWVDRVLDAADLAAVFGERRDH